MASAAAGPATEAAAAPPPQPAMEARQQDAAVQRLTGGTGEPGRPLEPSPSGSMEDVWKDILSTHHSTLDFATYTPRGDSDDAGSSVQWSNSGVGSSGSSHYNGGAGPGSGCAPVQGSSSAEKALALPGGADPYISELDLMPGGGSSSGGDRLAPGRQRTRDVAKRKAKRAAAEVKQALRSQLSRSFTEYRAIAGESFIDPKTLTKVANLGAGAFAQVEWAVLRQPNGEDMNVAVKRLRPDLISSDQDLSDFVREGALLQRLNHPSIVKFVGLGFRTDRSGSNADAVSADSMFIVQQFMNGGTLKLMVLEQMVAFHKTVYKFGDALRWTMQLAKGLAYLHGHRPLIIHRDLKLENCLLTDDGDGVLNARLADFGLHAIVEANDRSEAVQRIKRLASTSANEAAANRAVHGLQPAKRLDSLLQISGPSSARLSRSARSLARSASAIGSSSRPAAPPLVKRSASEVTGNHPYRPSRLGRRSKDSAAAAAVAAVEEADAPEPADSPARGKGTAGLLGNVRRNPMDDSAEASEQLLRGVGERGSRVWNRLHHTLGMARANGGAAKYDMTGQTGSFMYMAPEVMNSRSYNEKVDIFSFGVILMEVFAKSVTGAALLTVGDMEECEMYAWKVAHGYRRPIPLWFPPQLGALIVECWDEDPDKRPAAAEVVRRLEGLSADVDKMDHGRNSCCCRVQ